MKLVSLRGSLLSMGESQNLLRELPSIDRLLSHPTGLRLLDRFNRAYVIEKCRGVLGELRAAIQRDETIARHELEADAIMARLAVVVDADLQPGLRRVVNATGTLLHTNLGRALLPEPAIEALCLAGRHPVNLEYDLDRGVRGKREDAIERLAVDLTGAEAATIVNNNAAAVLLALNEAASGKEVIVSRGELIEIGGAFRIPEIMAKSGAVLREVGTTNRTHLSDYEDALCERTGLLLKVHTSNYRIVGFTSAVSTSELVALGKAHGVPVMEDLGSGALVDLSQYGLPKEPVVREQVATGADIVTFSGDKVLGGPQVGFIVGRKTWMRRIAGNPLHRALRCGKLTVAAVEATLRLYQRSADLAQELPTLRALTRSVEAVHVMAVGLLPALQDALGRAFVLSLEDSTAEIGSGALPTEVIPSKVIAIEHKELSAEQIAQRFRQAQPSIIGRIKDGRFLLDLRGVFNPQDLIPNWGTVRGA